MRRYAVVIEKTGTGFGAYVPDVPGCVSTGRTVEETERNIREAIAFHLDGMREDGSPIPETGNRHCLRRFAGSLIAEPIVSGPLPHTSPTRVESHPADHAL